MASGQERETNGAEKAQSGAVPLTGGLSTKLLLLTILFVMAAEVLIFIPSVANFGLEWMNQRLRTVAVASIALTDDNRTQGLTPETRRELLMSTGARAIAVRDGGTSRLMIVSEMPPQVDRHINLDGIDPLKAIRLAFDTMIFGGDRTMRVFGRVGENPAQYEIVLDESHLRSAMLVYARNVALLSLIISLFTATLVFYAINRIMIRPIRAMTQSMLEFAAAPDDSGHIIKPENRNDEIGVAEYELADMQTTLHRTLGERKRLADLGLAVSKINHDMRNMLASAQLMSDRLSMIDDPTVQSLAPKLVRTLDRAVSYTEGVLAYGRTQEAPPQRRWLRLRPLVEDARTMLTFDPGREIEFMNDVSDDLEIHADSDQLFRVLANLCRNAIQAMAVKTDVVVVCRLIVSAERKDGAVRILVSDTGPGLPEKARENLFAAFRGSARSGGTGLGLAIANEIVRAHGGKIELLENRPGHTVFAISIPDGAD